MDFTADGNPGMVNGCSVYQMTDSREQTRGESNCARGDQAREGSLATGILARFKRNYSFEYMVGDKYSFVSIPLSVVKVTYRSDSIIERSLVVSDSSNLR